MFCVGTAGINYSCSCSSQWTKVYSMDLYRTIGRIIDQCGAMGFVSEDWQDHTSKVGQCIGFGSIGTLVGAEWFAL